MSVIAFPAGNLHLGPRALSDSAVALDWEGVMSGIVVDVSEAEANLAVFLDRVERGEEIILGRSGRPVARFVAYRSDGARRQPRTPGRLAGRIEMAPDFADTPEWLVDAFESGT